MACLELDMPLIELRMPSMEASHTHTHRELDSVRLRASECLELSCTVFSEYYQIVFGQSTCITWTGRGRANSSKPRMRIIIPVNGVRRKEKTKKKQRHSLLKEIHFLFPQCRRGDGKQAANGSTETRSAHKKVFRQNNFHCSLHSSSCGWVVVFCTPPPSPAPPLLVVALSDLIIRCLRCLIRCLLKSML